jgi:hypothetical protein
MPTTVGNILRAAETRPTDRYGVGVVALWPHLWSVLPESLRQDLATARLALDNAVAACLWAIIYLCAAAPLTWWAVPPALVVAATAWFGWIPARARVFADLVEAAYDMHRFDLYHAMRCPCRPPVTRNRPPAKLSPSWSSAGLAAGRSPARDAITPRRLDGRANPRTVRRMTPLTPGSRRRTRRALATRRAS